VLVMRIIMNTKCVSTSVCCECCQVDASASGRSLVQRSRTECGVCACDGEVLTVRKPLPSRGSCARKTKEMGNQLRCPWYLYRFSCLVRQVARLSSCERDAIKNVPINLEVFFYLKIIWVRCEVVAAARRGTKKHILLLPVPVTC
jgi:hypothetical protein